MVKNKDFIKSESSKLKDTIRELKSCNRKLTKRVKDLVGEIKTLQTALDESIIYINKELEQIPIEDIVKYFSDKKRGRVSDVQKQHKDRLNELKEKWQCFKCKIGYLRLIIVDRKDKKFYFRICVNKDCSNRTKLKEWDSNVKGIK